MTREEASPAPAGQTIRWARHYDAVVAILTLGRSQAIRRTTIALARLAPGATVLDVGCGTGDLTMRAKTRVGTAGQVSGVDAAREMIAVARRKAARAGRAIDYQVATIEALPFPAATFDAVLSSLMMHHLPGELKRQGLAEIRRVLKPGGQLLVLDAKRPTTRWGWMTMRLLGHGGLREGVQDLPALLAAAGFVGIEVGEAGFRPLGFVRGQVPAIVAAAH